MDLFGKNLSIVVSGQKTTGPTYPLFSNYAKEWPNLVTSIEYSKLKKIDTDQWKDAFMEDIIKEVKVWIKGAIIGNSFKKETHRNSLRLIASFPDIQIPGFAFKFSKPETIDNTRFGQTANIYITLQLRLPD